MCALQRRPPRPTTPSDYRRNPGSLKLHLNDLDDLVRFLSEHTSNVGISAGDARADTPGDLREATRKELGDVRIITEDPSIVITLARSRAQVVATDTSDEAKAIVDDICSLLRARQAPVAVLAHVGFVWLAAAIFLTTLAASIGFLSSPQEDVSFWSWWGPMAVWGLGVPVLLILVALYELAEDGRAVVIPEYRGEARGISRDVKAAIWVALVGVVGTILGAVISALVAR